VISVVTASVALAAGLAWSRRCGRWPASLLAVGGYLAVVLGAMAMLPSVHEVPGPVPGADGLVLDGFPAEVLAEFRVYSLMAQALMWLVIGVVFACVVAQRKTTVGDRFVRADVPV
jgi:predicted cobalt transporter CbtA